MSTTYKANAISNELADKLKARLNGSLALVQGFSAADQSPTIVIGAGSAGGANFAIKTTGISWALAQDILGLTANSYTPHVIQLVTEADPTAGAGADPTSRAQLMPVLLQCQLMGARVEWYETAAGTAPTIALLEAGTATLKASFDPDVYRPMIVGS